MNRTLWIAAPLVLCSGSCALIYQVVWTRELRFVFGGSTAASAAVISIFIAGLGFGGLWFGKRVEQSSKPLAFCARLEHDLFLVASEHAPVYDTDALRARLSREPFSRAMRLAWRTDSLEAFLGHYLANPAFARTVAKSGVPVNTDDRSPVEFGFARGLRENMLATKTVFARTHGAGQDRPSLRGGSVDWPRVDYERAAYPFVASGSPPTITLSSSYHKRLEVLARGPPVISWARRSAGIRSIRKLRPSSRS